jgi:hypothetical protein
MKDNKYRLFLFKPTAINYAVDWSSSTYREQLLGELKVDNLSVSIKLQDLSTINFDLPENIFGEFNPRLNEVLDNYIVELWYGDLSNPTIQRFIITKLPLEYNNGIKKYCYEGNSLEHSLEFKQMLTWDGVQVKDFYRTISYDYANNRFTETPSTGNSAPTYSISSSTYVPSGNEQPVSFITIPTTTAATTPPSTFDIFIYQYRRNDTDTLNSETSLIEYAQNIPSGTLYQNQSGFKPGFYVPVLDANGKVTSINIALPKDFREFNSASKVFEIFLYDNPVSRHFAIGINTDEEIQASDMYLDLAQDKPVKFAVTSDVVQNTNVILGSGSSLATSIFIGQKVISAGIVGGTVVTNIEKISVNRFKITISNNYTGVTGTIPISFESLNAAEYGNFAFTPQLVYSKNGLKLSHILNGNVENSTITYDGILYDSGYTIGTIDGTIAAKYRSNIELNNISKYEAIKTLAESFDAIAIFNSVNKTVSFYPDKNESVFTNNGLIITKENYLKDLTNDIDASKIVTKAYAAGKDNLPIALITPNGQNAWEDYSYYIDSFYVEYPAASGVTIINDSVNNINNNTGVDYTNFPTGTLARWIDSTEALKIAKWQYARDYFHDIMLGNLNPTVSEHDRYYDLYNLRSAALSDLVKEESKYFELKGTEYRYKYSYDFYVKENNNLGASTRQQTFIYKFDSSTTVADPGINDFRLNNASFSGVTKILIDDLDNSNVNRREFLAGITINKNPQIVLADKADVDNGTPINYVFYQIDSIESPSGYIVLNVTYLNKTGAGTTFTNTNPINLYFLTWEEIYKNKYDEAIAASAFALAELDKFHYNLYNTRFDGTQAESTDSDYAALVTTIQPNSFATKISEVQGFLNKSRWSIDEEKLKPFIKEVVMSDSNLDNELDLLNTTREYLIENSKPIVTLSIGIVDFLASQQSSVDWNKVRIGEIVNIYFPDFNIDTTAQLREIAIDFQGNTLNFVISTYRQYTRAVTTYIMRQIRKTYDTQTNKLGFQYDNNNIGSNRANEVNTKLTKDGFSSEEATIKLGAKSSDGSTSTEISGEGIISQVISVDPILETFVYKNEKTLQIADGTLTARNLVRDESDVLLYTTEVEVSGDNGLVIRKIDTSGVATPQVYIDTNGNASFAGTLVAPNGTIGGFTIGSDFIRSGADNTKLLLKQDATNPFISIGQSTNSYDQPGIFLGLDSVDNKTKFSINPLKTRTFNTTSSSTTLTTGDTTDLTPGMLITGSGILAGTYIESITNSTTLEMTGASNTTASGVSLSFTNGSLTYNGASLNVGGYNFSALGLSGSGSVRRASLFLDYDIRLDYDEFYMKSDAAGPSSYSETFINANSIKAAYSSLSANPIVFPSVYYTGTLNNDSINFTYENSGVNTNTGSIILKPFTTPSTGSYTISMPYQTGTIALINAVQTYTSEPIFSSGAVFGSAADASNSIEITSSGNIIFEGSSADGNETILTAANSTSDDRTITLPDATGTLALINAVQTYTSEPIFSSGAVFGSAADAANSIEITSTGNIVFEGSSGGADANETLLTVVNPTADQTYQLPNKTNGTYTIATTSDILDVETSKLSSSDWTSGSTSFVDTGLTITLLANKTYEIELLGRWERSTTGSNVSMSLSGVFDGVGGTAPTIQGHWYFSPLDNSTAFTISNNLYTATISDNQTGNTLTTSSATTTVTIAAIGLKAIITTGSADRVFKIRGASSASAPQFTGLVRYTSLIAREI